MRINKASIFKLTKIESVYEINLEQNSKRTKFSYIWKPSRNLILFMFIWKILATFDIYLNIYISQEHCFSVIYFFKIEIKIFLKYTCCTILIFVNKHESLKSEIQSQMTPGYIVLIYFYYVDIMIWKELSSID